VVPRLHPFREEGERGRRATLPEIIQVENGTVIWRERESFKWEAKQRETHTSKIKRRRRSGIDKE
jgi:hypothetical protein